jgi:hypothetical protein
MTVISQALLRHFVLGATGLVLAASSQAQSVASSTVLMAQAAPQVLPEATTGKSAAQQELDNKKRWSVSWGWNRSNYSNSDIHFSGSDHDFTLKNVQATDLQTNTGLADIFKYYLNPAEVTIPQTNLRVAYQWNADTAIALNLDHMKYVVTQDQSVDISGQINGVAQSGQQVIADNWLNYEHTDGLNIVSLELEKQRRVDWFGTNRAKVFGLVGVGIVVPKTNATMHMINQSRNDEFHVAGWSVGAGAGLEVDVWKDVFLRTAYKMGYVDLPDVLTSARGDKASQRFTYNELLIAVGIRF